jgi:hypothetical protein
MTSIAFTQHEGLRPVTRAALAAVAFAGSAVYALSFAGAAGAQRYASHAAAVGVAAGLSWIIFGVLLIAATRGRPSVASWIDACLATMAVGIAIKMIGVVLNLVWGWNESIAPRAAQLVFVHLAILACADVAMGARFCFECRARGVSLRAALALWLAINLVFGVLLFTFSRIGGLS